MRQILIPLLIAALVGTAPAAAQERWVPTVGAMVYDPQGGEVGVVQSVTGEAAILSTGSARVTLGLSSFHIRNGRLSIGLTRRALEEAASGVQARSDEEVRPLLNPGATIYGRDGAVAATVESILGSRVTILAGTIRAVFPLSAFTRSARGAQINRTVQELQDDLNARSARPNPDQPAPRNPSQE